MSDADALSLLLPTQSFLLAAAGLALAADVPGKPFVSAIRVHRAVIPVAIIVLALVVMVGTGLAWHGLFGYGGFALNAHDLIAACLVTAIVGQAVLTIVFAASMFEHSR